MQNLDVTQANKETFRADKMELKTKFKLTDKYCFCFDSDITWDRRNRDKSSKIS